MENLLGFMNLILGGVIGVCFYVVFMLFLFGRFNFFSFKKQEIIIGKPF